jgi:hypothetical protein
MGDNVMSYAGWYKKAWAKTGLAAAWAKAPQKVRDRFIADVLS